MYDEFFSKAYELIGAGQPFATAIVVRAEKPTSAKPGDKAIITATGVMHGWIGGSCAQPKVIEEGLKALADGTPRLIRLSTDPETQSPREGLLDLPMTCFSGGTLEIYIEPHLPLPRLMVVGSLPVAQALTRLGKAMNYQVTVVDPDSAGASTPEADEVISDIRQMTRKITPLTYVVVASHGNYDELALEQALRSQAAYVALVASKKRSASVLAYLAAQGMTAAELARLKYPAGLDIQAVRGDEIALSIMAEIVQKRRNEEYVDLDSLLAETVTSPGPTAATDPVCGMTVQIAEARHMLEYAGQMYYFCCAGCKNTFTATPEAYLQVEDALWGAAPPSGDALDPVCGMTVDIATARYMSEYEAQLYYFCGPGCKQTFDEAPAQYVSLTSLNDTGASR